MSVALIRILTGKNNPQIKFQRLQKVRIWTFGSLVHQNNSIRGIKLKQKFQKNEVVTGKTPFFVIAPFCTHYTILFILTLPSDMAVLYGNSA